MKEIIERLKSDYAKLKSLTIKEGDGCIMLSGVRYRGYSNAATIAQVRYLQGMDNVDYYSTSNLMKGNKWFMSACIEIAKAYPDTKFKVEL